MNDDRFGLDFLDAYDTLRRSVDRKISAVVERMGNKSNSEFAPHRFELPSLVASMIAGEEVETDIVVLKSKDELLVDCGLSLTSHVSIAEKFGKPVPELKGVIMERVKTSGEFALTHYALQMEDSRQGADMILTSDNTDFFINDDNEHRSKLFALAPAFSEWYFRFFAEKARIYLFEYPSVVISERRGKGVKIR